ncbi:MAG: cysteine--tRNA ligase [Candidatus Margulisiibacteriota bacterium]
MISFYNTLTRQVEPFQPLNPPTVTFYVCGVTVYDRCHLGHARAYVAFDIMRRILTASGYQVRYIQNFTDIDDKIITRANERGIQIGALTKGCIQDYFTDMDALHILRADAYPRATEYIEKMQDLIQCMLDQGTAYVVQGDVYFSVAKFPTYGRLARKKLDELDAGIRVELTDKKRGRMDFVLWKAAKPGEPSWDSPWGPGRPGWHIECSAMAMASLGPTIDIHGGGEDLIFPHHENEIAQSEACTHQPFARYWIHNGFVNLNHQKMSKSTQNFLTVQDALAHAHQDGMALRFYLLRVHYRSPFQFSYTGLDESTQSLSRLRQTLVDVPVDAAISAAFSATLADYRDRFMAALSDDFNTAEAVGLLFDLSRDIHREKAGSQALVDLAAILGLDLTAPPHGQDLPAAAQALLDERAAARKARDFAASDRLRDQLRIDHGIVVEDTAAGQRWKRMN